MDMDAEVFNSLREIEHRVRAEDDPRSSGNLTCTPTYLHITDGNVAL